MLQTTALFTKTFGFLVDGKWLSEGEPLDVRSPYDGSTVATTFRPSPEHVEAAIQGSVRAFERTRK
ncbi:MAG TPA: aldehyde dehydrogenase, partial [Terriglobia bacterium]|nr:aldehyde dehydrogenase [Terriglobia bacterium]